MDIPTPKIETFSVDAISERINQCEHLLGVAYEYVEKEAISYSALNVLLSSAYRFVVGTKARDFISKTRRTVSFATKKQDQRDRAYTRFTEKGHKGKALQEKMKKYVVPDHRDDIRKGVHDALGALMQEKQRYNSELPEVIEEAYAIDLTELDSHQDSIVAANAAITVKTTRALDLKALKRTNPDVEILKIDHNLYVFPNALMVGFFAHVLPKKRNEESLINVTKSVMGIDLRPSNHMMRHKTSRRLYFMVPQIPMMIQTCYFSDTKSNRESLSVELILKKCKSSRTTFETFTSLGMDESSALALSNRWNNTGSSMYLFRQQALILMRSRKNRSLRERRDIFELENGELISDIETLTDTLAATQATSLEMRKEFKILTSPTAEKEDGIGVDRYKRDFDDIMRRLRFSSLRGDSDPQSRMIKEEALHVDKMAARVIYYAYLQVAADYKTIKAKLQNNIALLELNRRIAAGEDVDFEENEKENYVPFPS